jgi:hypothetical protein
VKKTWRRRMGRCYIVGEVCFFSDSVEYSYGKETKERKSKGKEKEVSRGGKSRKKGEAGIERF